MPTPQRIPLDETTWLMVENNILRLELAQARLRQVELAGEQEIYTILAQHGVPPTSWGAYRVDFAHRMLVGPDADHEEPCMPSTPLTECLPDRNGKKAPSVKKQRRTQVGSPS